MKALTIHQPWAAAIAHGSKRVENRTWAPSPKQLRPGDLLAIHAGKAGTDRDIMEMAGWIRREVEGVPDGSCITELERLCLVRGAIVAIAVFDGVVTEGASDPYFAGPYGWVLRDVVSLHVAVPCLGAQGIWTLDAATAADVMAQPRVVDLLKRWQS